MENTTKKRLAKAIRALGWACIRLAGRLDPIDDDEDDHVGCEQCSARVAYEDAVRAGDCYLCLSCHEAWRIEAAKCEHRWGEQDNEHGDPGFCCHRCGMWSDADPLPVTGFERVEA